MPAPDGAIVSIVISVKALVRHVKMHSKAAENYSLCAIYYLKEKLLSYSYNAPYFSIYGGARRDRTDDLLNAIQALSQLSYGPLLQRTGSSAAVKRDILPCPRNDNPLKTKKAVPNIFCLTAPKFQRGAAPPSTLSAANPTQHHAHPQYPKKAARPYLQDDTPPHTIKARHLPA